MTAITAYSAEHVRAARDDCAAQVAAYRALVAAASKASGISLTRIDGALAAFEPGFFNALLVALDARFVHRSRAATGHDGDPLDEVRMLAGSLISNRGVLAADEAIAYRPEKSLLKLDLGERIALNADDFTTLSAAFLDEIERRYPPA